MTTCPDEKELQLLADGELRGSRRSRIAEHVKNCRRCAEDVEQFRKMGQLISTAIREETESVDLSSLWRTISDHITVPHVQDREWKSVISLFWKPAARIAYAALLVLAGGLFVIRTFLPPRGQRVTISRAKVHSVHQYNPNVTVSMIMGSEVKPAVVWISGIGPSEEN